MADDRVVVITGSSSGLGAALLSHFARQGHPVVMNYVVEKEAHALYDELKFELGGDDRLLKAQADVSNREQVKSMFDRAVEKFGHVDILINCAGINRDAPFAEMTDALWEAVVSTHLKGTFISCQEFLFHNPDRPGYIINLGAACGLEGRKNGVNFCAAKAGIIALTKCLARELAPRIQVNCLIPGSVNTREVAERYDLDTEKGRKKLITGIPMGRLGELDDVIHMVQSMVDGRFTTGANFFVNGGELMH